MKRITVAVIMILVAVFCAVAFDTPASIDSRSVSATGDVSSYDGYDFYVQSAFIDIMVDRSAVFMVSEEYNIFFNGPHHGFVRSVPLDYSSDPLSPDAEISGIKCSDPIADIWEENGYCNIQIGSVSTFVDGIKRYALKYDYDCGDDGHDDYDEFYYNIVGDSWDCPFDNIRARISIPFNDETEKNEILKYWFFTDGMPGSTSFSGEKKYQESGSQLIFEAVVPHLEPGQAFTARIQLPEGYWNSQARRLAGPDEVSGAVSCIFSVIASAAVFLLWYFKGRGRSLVMNVSYEAPDGLSPLLTGFAYDGVCNTRDATSMIYYWADCGLISISGDGDSTPFVLSKIRDIPAGVPEAERVLFDSLFSASDTVNLGTDSPNTKFCSAVSSSKGRAAHYFSGSHSLHSARLSVISAVCTAVSFAPLAFMCALVFGGYLAEAGVIIFFTGAFFLAAFCFLFRLTVSRRQRNQGFIFPAIISVLTGSAFSFCSFGSAYIAGLPVCGLLCMLCSLICAVLASVFYTRTEYGISLFEKIIGFRDFIDKAEKDRLILMIDREPGLYYRVLSYAIVFGLEEKWASKFDSIAVQNPSWYAGCGMTDAFFRHRFIRSVRNQMSHYSSVPVQVSNSPINTGGSSFGSSGFSGGGHGGGGGHAW